MRKLLAIREARIFLFGWTVSQFGDWAMFFALAIWAKDLTGSNAAAGLIFFALGLPGLLAPLGGLVVDRLPRRRVLICVYSSEALVVLSLLFVHDRSDIWILYAVTAFYGLASAFGASARSAFMTIIIPRELLPDANGMFQTTREGLRLIAPLAGAAIYASSGGHAVAVLDSASFAAVVISLLFIPVPEPRFEREESRFISEFVAGARHIAHTIQLRQIVIGVSIACLVIGFSEVTIFAALQYGLHRPASFFGVIGSIQGVGAIAGGLTAAPLLRRIGDVKLVGLGLLTFAVGDLTLASADLRLIVVGVIAAGAAVAWFIVGYVTAVQTRTPARLQGRVSSAADVSVNTPQTASIALGAVLISIVDYRVLIVASSMLIAACGIYLASRRLVTSPAESPSAETPGLLPPSAAEGPVPPLTATTAEQVPDQAASGRT